MGTTTVNEKTSIGFIIDLVYEDFGRTISKNDARQIMNAHKTGRIIWTAKYLIIGGESGFTITPGVIRRYVNKKALN